ANAAKENLEVIISDVVLANGVSASIGRVSISSSGVVIVMSGVEEAGVEFFFFGVEEGEGDTDAVGGFDMFVGLRISEAIEFDLNLEHQQVEYKNLYLLRELAPHTLRRCFATYQAISGMPLPVLQKVLGHNNLATTSYYIRAGDLDNLVKFRPV
ncbi:8807_t:CDS:2, partial [Cetraspora pellucida]